MSKQLRARLTRESLAQAARELFAELPYPVVTMRAIASRAGRAHSSTFRYWSNKAELWVEVMGSPPPIDQIETRGRPVGHPQATADAVTVRRTMQRLGELGIADLALQLDEVAARLEGSANSKPAAVLESLRKPDAGLHMRPIDNPAPIDAGSLASSIAALIRTLRKRDGLTLADLARTLNTSIMQVSRYETGKSPISAARLAQLAVAYGWSIALPSDTALLDHM